MALRKIVSLRDHYLLPPVEALLKGGSMWKTSIEVVVDQNFGVGVHMQLAVAGRRCHGNTTRGMQPTHVWHNRTNTDALNYARMTVTFTVEAWCFK